MSFPELTRVDLARASHFGCLDGCEVRDILAAHDAQAARADLAERRERELREALLKEQAREDHTLECLRCLHNDECTELRRLTADAGVARVDILAVTVTDEPRAAADPDGFDASEPRMQFESADAVVAYLQSDDDEPRAGQPPQTEGV